MVTQAAVVAVAVVVVLRWQVQQAEQAETDFTRQAVAAAAVMATRLYLARQVAVAVVQLARVQMPQPQQAAQDRELLEQVEQ
jgi:hypothetical protein